MIVKINRSSTIAIKDVKNPLLILKIASIIFSKTCKLGEKRKI
ncbi:hypothetical protein AQPE_0212 [Aquipluma nitroreducens]|uniref:Uncharacterized protein n=1 Tax=Aquipluma nitroreducens TaxID=2010828 RepID=A0A5K7S3M2_9BACT|nr:hypothetical protein AQPE_0212 [Aquipluma nitroreducens]